MGKDATSLNPRRHGVPHQEQDRAGRRSRRQAQAQSAAAQMGGLKERVAPAAEAAAEVARERAHQAKDWAIPHVEHGIEVAAPKLRAGGRGPRPEGRHGARQDRRRPAAARSPRPSPPWRQPPPPPRANAADVADRSGDAYAVLKGEAVGQARRKGKVLLTLGLLAAAAAAAAVVFKKSAPRDDPWATPLEDPYTAPGAGRDSTDGRAATRSPRSATPPRTRRTARPRPPRKRPPTATRRRRPVAHRTRTRRTARRGGRGHLAAKADDAR